MADGKGVVVLAGRIIYADDQIELILGFDAGEWTLESRLRVFGRPSLSQIGLTTAAMDALVAGWPGFRAEVER